jgi:tRNA modification GTPase
MEDTIAAISTPIGEGGIAIVRVSGPRAFDIADDLFVSRAGKPSAFPSHTIHFGSIGRNGDLVDQVMLTVMRGPRTYTTEDVIEINCHGGLLAARQILSLCLQHGARVAEPGEFTKRAFLNGRIDLVQAEAVMDLIQAKTERTLSSAAHALEGHLSARINALRDRLLTIVAHLEAHIDFPEEDIAPDTREKLQLDLEDVVRSLNLLIATARDGKILRDGIAIAIVGRPNVGKSSIMNALLGHDRSIVTHIPGTTRDTVEDFANIRGIPVRLTDTAGVREPRGTVEYLGVERSHKTLQDSQIALHILDGSRPFSPADRRIANKCAGKPTILVRNKADLPQRINLPGNFTARHLVVTSTVTGAGIEELKDAIALLAMHGTGSSAGFDVAVNERHAEALRRAKNHLTRGLDEMARSSGAEIVSQQLRAGFDAIGEVVGKTATEDILDKIFSTFCIGK